MLQNAITTRQRHERFIQKACETGTVYGLESGDGFATSSSNEFEDDEGEPIGMICFWSEAGLARACAKDGWAGYEAVEVTLSDFIENWCVGMSNDDLLAGTNFDQHMFGFEADPLDLIIDLNTELKKQGKQITLKKYADMDELLQEIEDVRGSEQ